MVEEELHLDRDGLDVPATLLRPASSRAPLPAWIVLHGMTRPGRRHEQLRRFAGALVSSGAAAIIPDVPEWRDLRLAPGAAEPTVDAALQALGRSEWVGDRPVGVIGFSFGAPHAIATAANPRLSPRIAGVAGFGGYCDVEATFRFMMCGSPGGPAGGPIQPDPYGRWVVGANYLCRIPGLEDHEDVQSALRQLAVYSGDLGDPAWEPIYDAKIVELRDELRPGHREIFDLFAPLSGASLAEGPAGELAIRMACAARQVDEHIDPTARLASVQRPAHVLHGTRDRLISSAEAPKLLAALPAEVPTRLTVTPLFGHTGEDPLSAWGTVRALPAFLTALTGVLAIP